MATLNSSLILSLIDRVTAPSRAVDASLSHLRGAAARNSAQLNALNGQMLGAVGTAMAMAQGLSAPIQAAIEFESALADVAKVSGFDDAGLDAFGKDISALATGEIPLARKELLALAASAAQSGIADDSLLDFTRMTAKAAMAWGQSGDVAGDNLAKIQSALGLTIDQTMLYADAINHLSDNTASSATDMTDFARSVGSQGEFFGYTKEETLAFGAAMVGTGSQVEVAATSFRNMGRALTKGTAHTPKTIKAFRQIGLDAAKVAKGMQEDAVGTTLEVIKRIGQVPEHLRPAIMQQIFGDEARALAPLLGNVEVLERALGYVADETAYAGSVQREFANRVETSEFKLQLFQNRVEGVSLAIGNALKPALDAAMETFGPWLDRLSELIAAHPGVVQAVVGIAGALVSTSIAATALRWSFLFLKGGLLDVGIATLSAVSGLMTLLNPMNIVKHAALALRTALLFSGVGLAIAGIALAGTWIYNNWSQVSAFFEGFGAGIKAAMAPVMPAIQPVIDWISGLVDWFAQLVGPMDATSTEAYNLGTALGSITGQAIVDLIATLQGLPGAAMEAAAGMLAAGAQIGSDLWSGIVSNLQGIGQAVADFFTQTDWVAVGISIANAIWQGIQQIIPNMVAGLGDALAGAVSGLFGGGQAAPAPLSAEGQANLDYVTNLPTNATGGWIKGPGTGTSDSIVSRLSNGEYVVNANAASRYGSLLDQINFGPGLPTAPALPSLGAGAAPGRSAPSIGDIHVSVQVATNADPNTIARAVGEVVSARARAAFSDGAY